MKRILLMCGTLTDYNLKNATNLKNHRPNYLEISIGSSNQKQLPLPYSEVRLCIRDSGPKWPPRSLAENKRDKLGHITEFVFAIALFLILIFPFINILQILASYATVCLITQQAVSQASKQHSYSEALKCAKEQAQEILNSPFAKFAKLSPVGGYQNSGTDLFVDATNYISNSVTTYGPNTAVPSPLDPQTYVYEYSVKSTFEAEPFVLMNYVPVFNEIPGLGKPITLTWRCVKAAEHTNGVAMSNSTATAYSGGAMSYPGPVLQTIGPEKTQAATGGWNNPTIYEQIKATGQTVLAQDVVIVQANNSYWTPTSIEVPTGAKVWIDYRADGAWSVHPTYGNVDADGHALFTFPDAGGGGNGQAAEARNSSGDFSINNYHMIIMERAYRQTSNGTLRRNNNVFIDPQLKFLKAGMLLGKVGVNGKTMLLGKCQWNKPLDGSGKLYLGAHDDEYPEPSDGSAWSEPGDPNAWISTRYNFDAEKGLGDGLVLDGQPPNPGYKDNKGTMEVRIVIAK